MTTMIRTSASVCVVYIFLSESIIITNNIDDDDDTNTSVCVAYLFTFSYPRVSLLLAHRVGEYHRDCGDETHSRGNNTTHRLCVWGRGEG